MPRYVPVQNHVHNVGMKPIDYPDRPGVLAAWKSKNFLAVLWNKGGYDRLSVNRTSTDRLTGSWRDGITWDELQLIKAQCGFGDRWAVEVFPPDDQVVNVSAMRHLWLLDAAPEYAWTSETMEAGL